MKTSTRLALLIVLLGAFLAFQPGDKAPAPSDPRSAEVDSLKREIFRLQAEKTSDSLRAELVALQRLIAAGWGPCCCTPCSGKTTTTRRSGGDRTPKGAVDRPAPAVPAAAPSANAIGGDGGDATAIGGNAAGGSVLLTLPAAPAPAPPAKAPKARRSFFEGSAVAVPRLGALATFGWRTAPDYTESVGFRFGVGAGPAPGDGTSVLFAAGADGVTGLRKKIRIGKKDFPILIGAEGTVIGGFSATQRMENAPFVSREETLITNPDGTSSLVRRQWVDDVPVPTVHYSGLRPEARFAFKAGTKIRSAAALLAFGVRTDGKKTSPLLGFEAIVKDRFKLQITTGGLSASAVLGRE